MQHVMSDEDKIAEHTEDDGSSSVHLQQDTNIQGPSIIDILKKYDQVFLRKYYDVASSSKDADQVEISNPDDRILEGCGELSRCMYHVRKCAKQCVELRMILPELNRSTYIGG